jgi:hypothetical protein
MGRGKSFWRKAMTNNKERFARASTWSVAVAVLTVLITGGGTVQAMHGAMHVVMRGAVRLSAQDSPAAMNKEKQVATTQGKFYCNIKALTPAERAHHKQLSEKLQAARTEIVETAKGYEFQYSPADVSVAEFADWVAAESKCCPFFDFHIDVEREGSLLCLRLTGEEGIKAFIRAEFQIQAK